MVSRTLAPEHVLPLLRGTFGRPYAYHDTVASTQELARELSHGGVVACELQTAGRGRLGSAWQCPHGAGVMFSLALEPRTPVERLAPLSLVVADAVCDAIGGGAQVHWPNDIVIAERKVTGILVEFRDGQAIVGVGVNANLTAEELPADTRVPATSLSLERDGPVDRPRLLADLLYAIEQRFEAFEHDGFGGLEHDGLRGRTITLVGARGRRGPRRRRQRPPAGRRPHLLLSRGLRHLTNCNKRARHVCCVWPPRTQPADRDAGDHRSRPRQTAGSRRAASGHTRMPAL